MTTYRAPVADMRIADPPGQGGQGRDRASHDIAGGDRGMGGHGLDHQGIAVPRHRLGDPWAAGILVLAGAITASHRRRVYDSVILKVLGATRRRVLLTYPYLSWFSMFMLPSVWPPLPL